MKLLFPRLSTNKLSMSLHSKLLTCCKLIAILTMGLFWQAANAHNLVDIYRLAFDNDPTFRAAQKSRLANRELAPIARANLLPQLNLLGTARETHIEHPITTTEDEYGYSLALTQSIFEVNKWMALREANRTVKQSEAAFMAVEQDLITRSAQIFFNVLSAEDNLNFAQSQRRQFSKQLEQSQQKFNVGLVAITEVKESQADYDNSVATVVQSRNNLAGQNEALRALINQPSPKLTKLKSTIPFVKPDPENIEQWVDTARHENYTLKSARFKADAAKENAREQKSAHLPIVNFTASYDDDHNSINFGPSRIKSWNVGFNGSLPILAGGRTLHLSRQAQYDYENALEDLDKARRDAETNTRNSYRGVLTSISRVHALDQTVQSRRTALRATRAGFDVGTKTNVDVLDRISDLFRSESEYSAERYNYILQSLFLRQAAGTLSIKDLIKLNTLLDNAKHRGVKRARGGITKGIAPTKAEAQAK